jgi:hypothetical protein
MADKIKHLQKVLREKMPHTRRGKSFSINGNHTIVSKEHGLIEIRERVFIHKAFK